MCIELLWPDLLFKKPHRISSLMLIHFFCSSSSSSWLSSPIIVMLVLLLIRWVNNKHELHSFIPITHNDEHNKHPYLALRVMPCRVHVQHGGLRTRGRISVGGLLNHGARELIRNGNCANGHISRPPKMDRRLVVRLRSPGHPADTRESLYKLDNFIILSANFIIILPRGRKHSSYSFLEERWAKLPTPSYSKKMIMMEMVLWRWWCQSQRALLLNPWTLLFVV